MSAWTELRRLGRGCDQKERRCDALLVRLLAFLRGGTAPEDRTVRLAEAAAQIRQRTEPQFLQLAEDLKALHDAAAELSRMTREQVTLVRNALGENRLTGAGGMADRSLQELQTSLAEAESRTRMLQRNSEAMRRLRGHGSQMERVASLLDVSGYGFAVESARSSESRQAFDTFVTELRNLAGRVRVLGESIAGEAEAARVESERLDRTVLTNYGGLRELTGRAEAAVRQTAQRVEETLEASWAALQEVERHTAQIAANANDAVYHLQFGDIVRQKLEHIEAALQAPAEDAGRSLSVQAGQLELIEKEISSAQRQIEQAFAGLTGEARLLLDGIGGFGPAGRGRGENDAIEELQAAFLKIDELRRHGRELCNRAGETAANAMNTAGHLSRYLAEVEEINQQMQRQALNAIIKTVLLGDAGRTLEILSMYVQRLFEESSGLVADTVKQIESISSNAACADVTNCEGEDASAVVQAGIDRLAGVEKQLRQAMESAAAQAGEQEACLKHARISLGFLSEMAGEIGGLRRRVEELLASTPRVGMPAPAREHAAGTADRYTIASERDVHRRVLGSDPAGVAEGIPESAAPAAEESVEEGLGDNVELF